MFDADPEINVKPPGPVIDEYADEPNMIELVKQDGATTVTGQRIMDEPLWYWPDR
ncbi:hypothetical protein ACFXPR_15815 [Nocardia tengchongensis]|uniref:hypothetical protein n=1 Tax=Nocardia tengchongensis TaxID=2055889 RepID=UPI0036A94A93